MDARRRSGRLGLSGGAAALALALAACGGGDGSTDRKAEPVAASVSVSPSVERELSLVDDEASADAGQEIVIDVLANDSVGLEDGTDAPLPDTYAPTELTLTPQSPTPHGTVTAAGGSLTYTPADGYAGEDEFTYEVTVNGGGPARDSAVVRITVAAPPAPTPTPTPARTPEAKTTPAGPAVHYANCDAARAAGAAPVRRGDPGYASHLDRDGDGVGCEPYGSSGSGGGSSSGGPSSGGSGGGSTGGGSSGGGSGTHYANCTAVRAAGAAPIHRGDPGYGSHLDRDGDGVACE